VRKVKAHSTEADVRKGVITEAARRGNDLADWFARKGAGLHATDPRDCAIVAASALLAQEAARWHVRAALAMVDAGSADTTAHDGLGRAGVLVVSDVGDIWELAGLPGGPPRRRWTGSSLAAPVLGRSGATPSARPRSLAQGRRPSSADVARAHI
jgi:hypothetical protein